MTKSSNTPTRQFRFSGIVPPDSNTHLLKEVAPKGHMIPPHYVYIEGVGYIPQYAPTVYGTSAAYDPPNDCDGYFMSSKYQPNNNCYAYGCVIASNSFPQPGRKNGYLLPTDFTGTDVANGAKLDGLQMAGKTLDEVRDYAKTHTDGHFVALLISPADPAIGWTGDYHWVRCDDLATSMWSQKDGSDQVTDFDFAGNPITDPATANWTVNQGSSGGKIPIETLVSYAFFTYMFVPSNGVGII